MIIFCFLLSGVALFPSLGEGASLTPVELLKRSSQSAQKIAFWGKEITVNWHQSGAKSTVALRYKRGSYERIDYLAPRSLKGKRIIITPNRRYFYDSKARILTLQTHFDVDSSLNIPLLIRNYTLRLEKQNHTVADRPCIGLRLIPRHRGKVAYILWLDRQSFFILKTECYRSDGTPAGMTHFVEFHPRNIPLSLFRVPPVRRTLVKRLSFSSRDPRCAWPHWLPGGYRFHGFRSSRRGSWEGMVSYFDGIDLITLHITPGRKRPQGRGVRRLYINNRLVTHVADRLLNVLSWIQKDHSFALIGDVDTLLLKQVAATLMPVIERGGEEGKEKGE